MINKNNISFTTSIFIILSAVILRILPHPPNFAPIGALALFSGAHLSGRRQFALPFAAMLFSDLIIGFHETVPFVYGSFLMTVIIGNYLQKNFSPYRLVCFSLLSSVLFFISTNFGSWAVSSVYAKTPAGLLNAYMMGIPFFRNTILGDLIYVFVFFYGFWLIELAGFRAAKVFNISKRS